MKKKKTFLAALILPAALLIAAAVRLIGPLHLRAGPETHEDTEQNDSIQYYGLSFMPDESLPRNEYAADAFDFSDDIFIRYDSDDAECGVDVSTYQGEIDWRQAAAAGVEFAMIRVGFRGYLSGALALDDRFIQNADGAAEAGVKIGAYFFSQAVTPAEAEEEADFVVSALAGYDVTYPVVFDWENVESPDARTSGISPRELTELASAFCARIAEAGYTPAVYFNVPTGYFMYDLASLSDYVFWLAEYRSVPTFYYSFDLWQYTDAGRVPGIDAPVDLNLCFRSFPG